MRANILFLLSAPSLGALQPSGDGLRKGGLVLLWLFGGARARRRLISSRFNLVCPEGLNQSVLGAWLPTWPHQARSNLPDSPFPRG